jgi:hypothetical protein
MDSAAHSTTVWRKSDVDCALQFFKKLVTALTKPAGSSYMGM